MQDLVEQLQKATAPDRELDAKLAAAVRYHPYGEIHWIGGEDIEIRATGRCVQAFKATGESCANWQPPIYTGSIDAALMLFGDHLPRGLHLYRNTAPDMGGKDWVVSHQSPTQRVAARSWPLAICIAALKTRASNGQNVADAKETK